MKLLQLIIVFAFLILVLSGCHNGSVTVLPVKRATWVISEGVKYRGAPAPPFVDRSGTGPRIYPSPGRPAPPLVTGFSNTLTPGAQPWPRDKLVSHRYLGLVKFGMNDPFVRASFSNPDYRLDRATLVIYATTLIGHEMDGVIRYETEVRAMRRRWNSGYQRGGSRSVLALLTSPTDRVGGYHAPVRLPPVVGSRWIIRVDISTELVQGWADGTRENHGVMFYPSPRQIGWNNSRLVRSYEVELKLRFRRR